MHTDNLPINGPSRKEAEQIKTPAHTNLQNVQQSPVGGKKRLSQGTGVITSNGRLRSEEDCGQGIIKSKTRYSSTKYKTVKPLPASNVVKRVQRLYTDIPSQPTQKQTITVPSKFNISLSTYPNIMDPSSPNPKAPGKAQGGSYNRNHPPHTTKQQLYEENMHLKALVNELKDSLARQKIQTELQKKKNKRYTNVLNREFKKELYYQSKLSHNDKGNEEDVDKIVKLYNSDESQNEPVSPQKQPGPYSDLLPLENSSDKKQTRTLMKTQQVFPELNYLNTAPMNPHSTEYMIAGIKQKYQELKTEHQKSLAEVAKYKNIDSMRKLQEISVYCMTLEESNKKLAQGLNTCKLKLASYESENPKQQKQLIQNLYRTSAILQLNTKVTALKTKNYNLRQQLKKQKLENKEQQKIIRYLQTMIIQKQNREQKSSKAIKKFNIVMQQMQKQLAKQKDQNKQLNQVCIQEMESLSLKSKDQLLKQRQLYEEALADRNAEIRRLEKEMRYMSTIIENWKLGEEKQPQATLNVQTTTARKRKESNVTGKEVTQRSVHQQKNVDGPLPVIEQKKQKPDNSMTRSKDKQQKNNKSQVIAQRVRRTSAIKHCQNAKKLRKVPLEQIIQLPQYIRYRLIGLNMSLEQTCKLLEYRPPASEKKSRSESGQQDSIVNTEAEQLQKWKKKYINQAELTSTLIQQPFKIRPEEAVLLARYIIEDEQFYQNEDTNNAFVYCDFENEIERTIAKSILRAFVQTHSTNLLHPNGQSSLFQVCSKQWQRVIQKSGARINTPLISIAPHGFITKERWNQLLGSIGVEIGDNVREWCVGAMLLQSEGLGKLKYRAIVPEQL